MSVFVRSFGTLQDGLKETFVKMSQFFYEVRESLRHRWSIANYSRRNDKLAQEVNLFRTSFLFLSLAYGKNKGKKSRTRT